MTNREENHDTNRLVYKDGGWNCSSREFSFLVQSNLIEGVRDKQSLLDSIEAWNWLKTHDELTRGIVLHLHRMVMVHQELDFIDKGNFRRYNVFVGSHIAPNWQYVPNLMDNWILDHMAMSPKDAHIRFEKIHPFADGNGRVGRMLYNWQNLKARKELHVIYDRYKTAYYRWFEDNEVTKKEKEQNTAIPWDAL